MKGSFADVARKGKITSSVGVSLPSEIPKQNIPRLHSVLAGLSSLLLFTRGTTHFDGIIILLLRIQH